MTFKIGVYLLFWEEEGGRIAADDRWRELDVRLFLLEFGSIFWLDL